MNVSVGEQWALRKMAFWNLVVTCELHYDFSYKIWVPSSNHQGYKYVSCHLCVNSFYCPSYIV
jgi:hypothetical protein